MLEGQLDLLIVKGLVDIKDCHTISDNFYSSPSATERKDNIAVMMVGVSHYFKTPEDYYSQIKTKVSWIMPVFIKVSAFKSC